MNRTLIARMLLWVLAFTGMAIGGARADPPGSTNSPPSAAPSASGHSAALSGSAAPSVAPSPRPARDPRTSDAHSPAPRGPTPLDLRLGDLRRYFTPAELQSPLPDMIGDEIVVEGTHGTEPDPSRAPIPVGLVAPFWAVTHPFSAWRVFVPDPNAIAAEP